MSLGAASNAGCRRKRATTTAGAGYLGALLVCLLAGAAMACGASASDVNKVCENSATGAELNAANMEALAEASNQFSLDLLRKFSEKEPGNVVFSPYSLFSALNLLSLGVSDKSASQRELDRLLGVERPEQRPARHEHLRALYAGLHASAAGPPRFSQASLVLYNESLASVQDCFRRQADQCYGAKTEPFGGAGAGAPLEERVNRWVRNATQGFIDKLLDKGQPAGSQADLALMLLNVAYFKANWLHPFKRTSPGLFFLADGRKSAAADELAEGRRAEVTFMDHKLSDDLLFGYADFSAHASGAPPAARLDCRVVSLPYEPDSNFSLTVLLPNKRAGLDELLAQLDAQTLRKVYGSLEPRRLEVNLPKFELESSLDARALLQRLHVAAIFEPSDDFRAMLAGQRPAAVDQLLHKARVRVDEKGTEAAGATMVSVVSRMATSSELAPFRANRPFLFVLRHNTSGVPLFMGRVDNPSSGRV